MNATKNDQIDAIRNTDRETLQARESEIAYSLDGVHGTPSEEFAALLRNELNQIRTELTTREMNNNWS